eukprot:SAG31_NODE_5232_length_2659_cov_1.977734_1_plen_535_part_00
MPAACPAACLDPEPASTPPPADQDAGGAVGRGRRRECVVPIISQKSAEVQGLCRRLGFGEPCAEVVAPCGLVATAVVRWLELPAVKLQLSAACRQGGHAALLAALGPLQSPAVVLPLLESVAAEVLHRRTEYIAENPDEFADQAARDAYQRGLVQPFEIRDCLCRNPRAKDVAVIRNVLWGPSTADRVRFWPSLAEVEADSSLRSDERGWLLEEKEILSAAADPSMVDFLVESVDRDPRNELANNSLQTLQEWAAAIPHDVGQTTSLLLDTWGHYSVLLVAVTATAQRGDPSSGSVELFLLDSLPTAETDLPTPQGETIFARLAPPAAFRTRTNHPLQRVVFLDCDGVLCNSRSQLWDFEPEDPTLIHDCSGHGHLPLERRCVEELRRVAAATGAVIVLSTTWRLVGSMRDFLVQSLHPLRVIGSTPAMKNRGQEVAAWLHEWENEASGQHVGSYCILDDEHADSFAMAGLSANHVRTVMLKSAEGDRQSEGLTTAKADEAIAILLRDSMHHAPSCRAESAPSVALVEEAVPRC